MWTTSRDAHHEIETMKFVAVIQYGPEKEKVKATHPAHREHLRQFVENGQLLAAGPFAYDAGALWVLEAETADAIEEIVKADPYVAAGVVVSWNVRPLAYRSAQAAKGSSVFQRYSVCQ